MDTYLLSIAWAAVQLLVLWIGADFITGLVHWWQDAYGNPNWPILGKYLVKPNIKHHHYPRAMLQISYWSRVGASIVAGIIIIFLLWSVGMCSWQVCCCIAFATQGNEIHAMAHRTNKENGRFIRLLQKIGLVQRRKTHGWHHKAPYDTNFFVMTEYLNPLFNKVRFFERLEQVVQKISGIKPLRGATIRDGV